MKHLLLIFAFLIPLFTFCQSDTAQVASCCGGKCTGSSYCTACKNCSSCKHCSSGGSCGVCSGVAKWKATPKSSTEERKSYSTEPKTNSSPKTTPVYTAPADDDAVFVNVTSQTLNLRSGPGVAFDIVLVLSIHETLKVLESERDGWIKVSASRLQGDQFITYQGYVAAKYVK